MYKRQGHLVPFTDVKFSSDVGWNCNLPFACYRREIAHDNCLPEMYYPAIRCTTSILEVVGRQCPVERQVARAAKGREPIQPRRGVAGAVEQVEQRRVKRRRIDAPVVQQTQVAGAGRGQVEQVGGRGPEAPAQAVVLLGRQQRGEGCLLYTSL